MIKVNIQDIGRGHSAQVFNDRSLRVGVTDVHLHQISASDLTNRKLLSKRLATAAGVENLGVNGSVTPVEYFLTNSLYTIPGDGTVPQSICIKSISVTLRDDNMDLTSGPNLRRFGSATAASTPLTNGLELNVIQGNVTTNIFGIVVGVLLDFERTATNRVAYKAVTSGPTTDFVRFDYALTTPVYLPKGSSDRISIYVRDNLSTVDEFYVRANGFFELELPGDVE